MRRLPFLIVLGALGAFGPLSIDMYLPALPTIADALSTSASQAQLTLTACLIGIGTGQIVFGPASDQFGRRRPLLASISVFVAASLLCAVAPSIEALTVLRLIQGFTAAGGIVIGRAIVRDVSDPTETARMYALMMLISGVAPIVAPSIGALMLHVTNWRGVFVSLALLAAAILVSAALMIPETLAPELRRTGGMRQLGDAVRELSRDHVFVGVLVTFACMFGALFAYMAGSSFVYQDVLGLSPQAYAILFGVNACGAVGSAQLGRRLVRHRSPRQVVGIGTVTMALAGSVLLVVTLLGSATAPTAAALFFFLCGLGLVMPNGMALALTDHPAIAGTAAGLLGVTQFLVGAIVAPIAGVAGSGSALPMAATIASLTLCSAIAIRVLVPMHAADKALEASPSRS